MKGTVSKKQVWEVFNGCGKGTVSKKQVSEVFNGCGMGRYLRSRFGRFLMAVERDGI